MERQTIMRNMLAINIITGILFFISGCTDSNTTKCDTSKCADCKEYNNVGLNNKLDYNLLQAMAYNYKHDPATATANPSKTRSVWISLEKLKALIYQIEKNTCTTCPDSVFGVRVYFGQYPADIDWTTTNGFKNDLDNPVKSYRAEIFSKYNLPAGSANPYAGINTIFMVPTIQQGGINYDFDPSDTSRKCTPGYNWVLLDRNKENSVPGYYLHNSAGYSVPALSATNHGDACPPYPNGTPPCPGNAFGNQ